MPLAGVGAAPGAVVEVGVVPGTGGEVGPPSPGVTVAPVLHVAGGFSNGEMRIGPFVAT